MPKKIKEDAFQQVRIQTLAILLAIDKHGSAKVVADEFKTHVSVVTRQIHELEKKLGVDLFKRHSRGMVLTPAGKTYAKSAARIIAELEHARSKVGHLESEPKGRVRVHISEVLVDDYLLPVVGTLARDFPAISVDAVIGPADQAREALLNHATEFATTFGVKQHEEIEVVREVKYPVVAVVHCDHALASQGEIKPADLLLKGVPIAAPRGRTRRACSSSTSSTATIPRCAWTITSP